QTARATTANAAAPPSAARAVGARSRSRIASAGYVVITASGITNVNTNASTPRNTDDGQRAASYTDANRYVRLSTLTTTNASDTTMIQIEYRITTAPANNASARSTAVGDGTCRAARSAHTSSPSPPSALTPRHRSKRAVETRNCASAGLSSTKSN